MEGYVKKLLMDVYFLKRGNPFLITFPNLIFQKNNIANTTKHNTGFYVELD